jgi:hypothetical protein
MLVTSAWCTVSITNTNATCTTHQGRVRTRRGAGRTSVLIHVASFGLDVK